MTDIPSRLATALAGRYEIQREIGMGGMATVYLAHDVKHHRNVALKVLRPELAAVLGAERFVQEITTTASLQHPHILPLYDSGTADGFLYYVMPFIDGETVRDKLNRETQLGIDEAVRIATEVAGALDYAHRQGVIHRDIKPENILLHDGRATVADFGIALAVSAAAGGRMTETGLSLGTPHYMSPEQATAEKDLTSRSDIYSLGCVLYEMLTGDPPHTASSAQQIIMKIVTESAAPVTTLRKSVPPHVAAALMKALEKLPADRFETAKGFADALNNPAFTVSATAVLGGAVARPSGWNRLSVALLVVATVATVSSVWGWVGRGQADSGRRAIEFFLDAPDTGAVLGGEFAISPDGQRVVYVVDTAVGASPSLNVAGPIGRGSVLYERQLDTRDGVVLPGTEGGQAPFFSPDGAWVGFHSTADGALKKIPVGGGAAQTIARMQLDGPRLGWGPDDWIYYSGSGQGINRVSANGGTPEQVTNPDTALFHWGPVALSSGKGILFTTWTGEGAVIAALDLESGSITNLTAGSTGSLAGPGELVYVTPDASIMAQRFNERSLVLEGEPRRLVGGVALFFGAFAAYAISPNGTLVYLAGGGEGNRLVLVDRNGAERPLLSAVGMLHPRFSPSGDRIAFAQSSEGGGVLGDTWVYAPDQGTLERLSFTEASTADPAWTPDGRRIAYSVFGGGRPYASLYMRAADGSGSATEILSRAGDIYQADFTPDGREVVFEAGHDVYRATLGDSAEPVPLLDEEWSEWHAQISPDGRWLAYTSDETGFEQIYVRSHPDMGARTAISVAGGRAAVWSQSGTEIFYRSVNWMMAASVKVESGRLMVTKRTPLFRVNQYLTTANRNYDVHPNGREFVMVGGETTRAVVRVHALERAQ